MLKLVLSLSLIFLVVGISKTGENNFVTVAIVGTNDIHGSAFPTTLFRSDKNETYTAGGL